MIVNCIPVQQKNGRWKCEVCEMEFADNFIKNCHPLTPEGKAKAKEHYLQREAVTKQRKNRIKFSCLHKGKSLRMTKCKSCCGNTDFFVFSCTIHNECVIDAPSSVSELIHCVDCDDYIKE